MAFKLAKLSVPDIGKAYGAGLNMKQTRLSNEVKEEAIAQKKATNEEYGNFLSENNPESIVDPVDENNNGKIDPEEETNALQATGRKYKAWDKIRDDKEIAARRAAVEGRSIRAEQRAVEKHQKYLERNELAASQKRNIEQSHREVGEELGYTGGRLDQYVQLAMKDKNLAQAAFRQLDYNDQIKKTTETDEGQKQVYLITKEYTDAYGKGSPEETKAANTAALKKLNNLLDGMDVAIETEQANGNTEKVAKIKRMKEKYKTLKGADGTFDYKASQKYSAQLADQKQDQTTELENQEDRKYLDNYWDGKKKKKGTDTRTADQKNAATYAEAKDTPKDKRTTEQQHVVSKADKSKATGKSVVEEVDTYLGIQDYSSKEEKAEATKLKAKALKFWRKDKTLTAFEAREMAVAETKERSGNALSENKSKVKEKGKKINTNKGRVVNKTKDSKMFGKDHILNKRNNKYYDVDEDGNIRLSKEQ